jgi:hypothetical protein
LFLFLIFNFVVLGSWYLDCHVYRKRWWHWWWWSPRSNMHDHKRPFTEKDGHIQRSCTASVYNACTRSDTVRNGFCIPRSYKNAKCDTTCPFYISHLWSIISVLYVIDVCRRVFLFLWLSRNVDTLSAIFLPSSPLFSSFYNNSVSLVNYDVSFLPMFRLYVLRVPLFPLFTLIISFCSLCFSLCLAIFTRLPKTSRDF